MRKFSLVATVMALFLLVVPAVPAGATPPSGVVFVETTNTDIVPPVASAFGASGAAVSDGIVCAAGTQIDLFAKFTGFQSGNGVNIKVVKEFTCLDGTFEMALQIREDKKGNRFNWQIINGSGTGAYERLHGTGKGIGERIEATPWLIVNTYTGQLHND